MHVPYRGTAPALSDVIAGHIHGVIDALISQLPAIQQGQVRVLGVSLKQRSALLPDVPTIDEFLPGYKSVSWIGMFAAPVLRQSLSKNYTPMSVASSKSRRFVSE